jgi:geranylgeranyl reductase family protein
MGSPQEDARVWDVAVIGSGPAGTAAALAAAAAGRRVLLLERASIPRYKTCGGGLIGASLAALPPGMVPPSRQEIRDVTFSLHGRLARTWRAAAPLLTLVNRDEFDAALVRAAVQAGVTVRDRVAVTRLSEDAGLVSLMTADGPTVRARAVVGADGSAGRAGHYVGVQLAQVDLGLELELPVPAEQAGRWAGRLLVDWGRMPGSYGWVFPKGETLSVGVIAARGHGEATRAHLQEFLVRLGLEHVPPVVSSGHLTRCRTDASPLSRGRVLVAGDAAGLLDPWLREGISFALRSGTLAGAAAATAAGAATASQVDAATSGYAARVAASLGAEMAAGRLLLAAFSRRPWIFHGVIATLPAAWRIFIRLATGQSSLVPVVQRPVIRRLLTQLQR